MTGPEVRAGRQREGRLTIGVVGAGRVGAVLGSALRAAGHTVVGASGVSEASRNRIRTLLPAVPVLDVREVVARAELVLVAVPDDALPALVRGLAKVGAWRSGQIVVHTAGRFGVAVLDPARRQGVLPLAIHPAMTFTGTAMDVARLTGATFAVTGPEPVRPIGQALVVELGGEPVVVAERDRQLYHAALAHGANHLVVLVAQVAQVLRATGIELPGRTLGPLLGAALDNALRCADKARDGGPGAIDALTGPVIRGDAGTVGEHLAALTDFSTRTGATDLPASYRELSRDGTRRALAAGRIADKDAERLLDVLEEEK